MNSKLLLIVLIAVLCVSALYAKTKEEWQAEYKVETYAPNNEIKGDYDRSLAVKCKNGTFVGKKKGNVIAYKGIPFAKQPVGKLRFKAPQEPEDSDKVFEAYNFGKSAVQMADWDYPYYEQGEDCLNLTIYLNDTDKSKNKPVLVFIHGGGFCFGHESEPIHAGYNFAENNPDAILIFITYRLGVYGMASFANIPGGENYSDAVNNAVLDEITALKWIKKNIKGFGGDPNLVTIFGESAGGASVSTLCIMPQAKGLFRRAIIQSGTVNINNQPGKETVPADNLAKAFNAKNMDDLIAIPEKDLAEYWRKNHITGYNHFVMDGKIIPADCNEEWKKGATKDIEILQGRTGEEFRHYIEALDYNIPLFKFMNKSSIAWCKANYNAEWNKLFDEYYKELKDRYGESLANLEVINDAGFNTPQLMQAIYHAQNGGKGYYYIFDKPTDWPEVLGAQHSCELPYVFGNFDGKQYFGTDEEVRLAKTVQRMWVNFAKTGNPSTDEYKWDEFNADSMNIMRIGDKIGMEPYPDTDRFSKARKMFETEPRYRNVNSISTILNYGATIFEEGKDIIATYGQVFDPPATFGD